MILKSIWLIVGICRSHRTNTSLTQIWPIGLAPWYFPMPAIHCKKLCFVQSEWDQLNIENICKRVSKINTNVGTNLGGNEIR